MPETNRAKGKVVLSESGARILYLKVEQPTDPYSIPEGAEVTIIWTNEPKHVHKWRVFSVPAGGVILECPVCNRLANVPNKLPLEMPK